MFAPDALKAARFPAGVLPMALLILALVALYGQVLGFGYVWDDLQLFIYSSDLRGDTMRIGRIFEPVLSMTTYFRPAVMLSFVLEFMAAGVSAKVSHAVNLVIFSANVLLVWMLAWAMLVGYDRNVRQMFASVGAAIYLVSPVQLESMAWVAGRFDLMCTFFVLLALLCAIRVQRIVLACLSTGIFFYLALLSKEMAVTFPVVLLLMEWVRRGPLDRTSLAEHLTTLLRDSRSRAILVSIGMAFVAYLVTRIVFIPEFIHTDRGVMAQLNPFSWMALIGHALLFYFRQILLPFLDISPLHNFQLAQLGFAELAARVLVLLATVAVVAHGSLQQRSSWGIWAAIVCVALSPVLHLIPLTIGNSIGHDRFLAFPFALFSIAVSCLGAQHLTDPSADVRRFRIYAGVGLLIWSLVSVINLRVTLPLWQSDLTLWRWAFQKDPTDEKARHLFLNAAIRSGHHELYAKHARSPANGDDMLQHAYFLIRTNQPKEALELLLKRLDDAKDPLKHSYYPPHFQISLMAEAYIALRDFGNGLEAANATMEMAPEYPPAYLLKSFALYGLRRDAEADAAFAMASRHLEGVAAGEAQQLRRAFLDQL